MNKKIAVNGREISVKEEDFEYLIGQFKEGVQIDDLQGWQSTVIHEQYDFEKVIEKAKEYSNKSPPDVVQFSEKAWGATALAVKEFYLKRFGILIKSHKAKSELLKAIRVGLNGKQSGQISDTWTKAENATYDMNFIEKRDRESLLDEIKEMAAIIEQADLNVVRAELNSLTSVTFRNCQKDSCKIGNNSYDFTRTVY